MSNPPSVRITVAYDDDPAGAAKALLAVLVPRRAPRNERVPVALGQARENAPACPATTPRAEEADSP